MIQRLWRSWRERLRRMVDGMLPNDEEVLTPDGALPDGESVRPSSAGAFEQANAPAKTPQPDAGLARQIKSRLRLGVLQRVSQALPVRVTRPDPIICYRAPTVMQNVPTGLLPMVKPHLIAGAPTDAAQEEDQAAQERAAADAAWDALWALRGTRSTAGQPVPAVPLSSTGQVDNETWEGETVGPLAAAPQSAAPQSAAPQSAAPQAVKLQPATSKKGPLPRVKAISRPVSAVSGPFSGQVKDALSAAPGHPGPQSAALQDGTLQPGVSQQPDAPQPGESQPGAPQTGVPQPGAPQPGASQPGAPQSAPQPSAPQFIAPQPSASQPGAPQPGAPQTGAPQPGVPQQSTAPQFIAPQFIAPQSDTTRAAVIRRPLARRVADKPVRPQVRRKLAPTFFPSAPVGVRPQQLPSTGRSLRQATQRETATQAISWPEAAPETPPKIPSTASGAVSAADVTSRPGPLLAALRAGLEKLGISKREATQSQAARLEAAQSRQHPSEPALARWASLPRSAVPGRLSLSEPVRPSEASSLSKPGAVVDEKLPVSSGERPVARRTATRTRSLAPAAPVEPHFGAGSAEVRSPLTGPVTEPVAEPVTGPVTGGASAAETSAGRGEDWTGQRRTSSAAATPTFLQPATPTTTTVWRTIRNQPDLTSLMRPTLVPVSIQREVEATAQPAAAEPQPASPSPAEDRAGDRTRTQTLDLESLSHQVYQIIRRRLAVERERERGR